MRQLGTLACACRIVDLDRVRSMTAVARFADCVGSWTGTNGFRLMPADAARDPAGERNALHRREHQRRVARLSMGASGRRPAHVRAIRAYAEAFGSTKADPVGAIHRIDGIDVSGLDPDQRERWIGSVAMAGAYAAAMQGEDVIAALADAWAI